MLFKDYAPDLFFALPKLNDYNTPWEAVNDIEHILASAIEQLDDTYTVSNGVAIHNTASVAETAIIHAPAIIGPGALIGHNTLIRGGVYLGDNAHIGQGVEAKHSIIGSNTALAHFNYVGDSILGSRINLEAGSVIANHYNEQAGVTIKVIWRNETVDTKIFKFGALLGDDCKLGANSVTTPGTVLAPHSVVNRLELIDQTKNHR